MLRQPPYCLIAALLISFLIPAQGGEPESGLTALRKFSASPSLAGGESILGMVGFYGDPLPPQWLILTTVEAKAGVLREVVFREGVVVAERRFKALPGQDLPSIPIPLGAVKVDSKAAFAAAERAAKLKKVSFDSVHYQLRCRQLANEPVWMLSLINSHQVAVGVVYISAGSGEVLQESWPRLPLETTATAPQGS